MKIYILDFWNYERETVSTVRNVSRSQQGRGWIGIITLRVVSSINNDCPAMPLGKKRAFWWGIYLIPHVYLFESPPIHFLPASAKTFYGRYISRWTKTEEHGTGEENYEMLVREGKGEVTRLAQVKSIVMSTSTQSYRYNENLTYDSITSTKTHKIINYT